MKIVHLNTNPEKEKMERIKKELVADFWKRKKNKKKKSTA